MKILLAAPFVLAAVLGPPALAQFYNISTVLGGLPANGSVAKTTGIGPYGLDNVTADSDGNLYSPC